MSEEFVTIPQDLTLLSDEALAELEVRATEDFDALAADTNVTPEGIEYQVRLTDGIERLRATLTGRAATAAQVAEQERIALLKQRATLGTRVHGAIAIEGEDDGDGSGGGGSRGPTLVDTAAIAEAAAKGATAAMLAIVGNRNGQLDLAKVTQRATASLSEARRHAPAPVLPKPTLAVTAGVDIPGVARGTEMTSIDDLVDAFQRVAKGMPATRDGTGQERLVATIRNEYSHTIDDRTQPAQVEELIRFLTQPVKQDALVAGGGWCAPSEIKYDFFNVACTDGLVDLPTVGITRGGIRFPVSPSMADAVYGTGAQNFPGFGSVFSSASDPWLWTETDDIATVTGSPNKPTMRVPCPTFSEVRLECYGLTMTAGNLTDSAYPEATANTLRLLMTAFEHAQNARIINSMVTLSSSAILVSGSGNRPAYNQILSGMDLAATDYRAKFAMCENDVLEVVAPFWLKDVIVADLAWRTKVDLLSVNEAQITGYFSDRNLRVQWVNDWQVRGAGQFGNPAALPGGAMVTWPTSADVLLYAAGTFIKGNGLTLDLGVVRDSVLNAENDFTAAWSEECHLVARVGHESRRYTIGFVVNGSDAGAQALGAFV